MTIALAGKDLFWKMININVREKKIRICFLYDSNFSVGQRGSYVSSCSQSK